MEKTDIGSKLVALRGKRSRREVADALGLSISAIAMYERNERKPRYDIMQKIAIYYKRSVASIFFAQ